MVGRQSKMVSSKYWEYLVSTWSSFQFLNAGILLDSWPKLPKLGLVVALLMPADFAWAHANTNPQFDMVVMEAHLIDIAWFSHMPLVQVVRHPHARRTLMGRLEFFTKYNNTCHEARHAHTSHCNPFDEGLPMCKNVLHPNSHDVSMHHCSVVLVFKEYLFCTIELLKTKVSQFHKKQYNI